MTSVSGVTLNSLYAYFYYFTSGQWQFYYASGLPLRENRLSACLDNPGA